MRQQVGIVFLFLIIGFQVSLTAAPIGKKTKVSFDKALPEDISNKNFPDIIESFDYPNANILDLVKAIGKLTGLNFIVDPSLSSKKITVIAPSRITIAEAYKAFLSALAINGYTLVKAGAFWKIQETKKALKDNTEIYSGDYFPNTDQLITRIIKLKYIDAKEFSDSIKYLLSQNNQVSYHKSSNSIIISDYGSVIERIMKIVYTMDTPGSKETIEVMPIQHAAAEDLADMLLNLLSINNYSSKKGLSSRSRKGGFFNSQNSKVGNLKISSIISDSRTNSIVVSANKEGLKRVRELVGKLDTYIDPSRTGGIYVYNVLYGTAEQVYNTLMGIGGINSKKNTSRGGRHLFNFGRQSSSRSGSISKDKSSPLFENVTILPDINTNSLIISAKNKYDFERVKEVLKKIDVPRDQVFVQAIIVEMLVDQGDQWEVNIANTLSKGLKGLLNLSGNSSIAKFLDIGGTPIAGFLNRSFSADPSFLQKSKLGPGLVLGLPLKSFLESNKLSPSSEVNAGLSSDFDTLGTEDRREALRAYGASLGNKSINQAIDLSVFPLLQLLKKAGNVNVLSTPQITALDNITASIEVGENAPVGIVNTSSSFSVSQNSVDRQDVTLKLEITPRINPDSGTIQMDISQKFDDFAERQSAASELKDKGVHIVKRNIETKMVLNDGETAVLGGLLTDKETRLENKVPILGDIPVLGWLFKGFTVSKEKRNLVVFITPKIIRGKNQKSQTRQLLSEKLEERIYFIRKYMKGKDPHGDYLKNITATSKIKDNSKPLWKKEITPLKQEEQLEPADFKPAIPSSEEMNKPSFDLPKVDIEMESPSSINQEEKIDDLIDLENDEELPEVKEDDSSWEENNDEESKEDEDDNDEKEEDGDDSDEQDSKDFSLKNENPIEETEERVDILDLDEISNENKEGLE